MNGYDRFVITGASGWVGRNAVDVVARQVGRAAVDRMVLSTSRAREVPTPFGPVPAHGTADLVGLAPGPRTLLIHCGFPTQDQVDAMGEQAYVDAITALRTIMLAVIDRLGAVDMIYISSGAATTVQRGAPGAHRTQVYGQAKIDDEAGYAQAIAATGGRLCVIRAFALSGPYMTKPESYALGSLILQAQRGGVIEVMADRPVRRSYMAMDDMLRIGMYAVQQLAASETVRFETAGEVGEVGDLARRTLAVLGHDPAAVTRPPLDPAAAPNEYLGEPVTVGALAAAAGVVPAPLDAQIAATADWLQQGDAQ